MQAIEKLVQPKIIQKTLELERHNILHMHWLLVTQ